MPPTTTHHVSVSRRRRSSSVMSSRLAARLQPMLRPHGVVFIVVNFLLLVLSFSLDLRDLYYKIKWIGPFDSYAFEGVGDHVLDEQQLVPTTPGNFSGQLLPRVSGWSSFLEPCDAMFGASFFLSSLGVNCTVGGAREDASAVVIPRLVLSGTMRVDAVAWASCQLLYYHRRPGLCHRRLVTRFLKRYAMEAPRIPRTAMARVDSPAEHELLHVLRVLSRSSRYRRIVCVEAFELHGPGLYNPTIFGCGSADLYAAAFAGVHATHLTTLLGDKAWLTLDDLNVMKLRYAVRQNDISDYHVRVTKATGRTIAAHHPRMNYSSSGHLYLLMVLSDLTVFVFHVLSALQVARVLLVPQLRFNLGYSAKPVPFFTGSTWLSLVSRSLVRSRPIAVLMAASQLVSWQLIMPNSVIWTWTENNTGRWQALLSSMRVWELILIAFVWLWECVVAVVGEHAAYAFTSRTFISLPEVVAVVGLMALLRRTDILSISDTKYAYDGQRLADWSSFVGAGGYANTYNADHDHVRSSSPAYWAVVYGPMARLALYSLAGFVVLVLLKMVYYQPLTTSATVSTADSSQSHIDAMRLVPYERLPVEMLLDVPIRAKSLLRFRFDMELRRGTDTAVTLPIRYVYAPLYFAFGALVDVDGHLLRRHGFVQAIPPCIDLSARISVNDSVALTGSTLVMGIGVNIGATSVAGLRRLTRGMSSSLVFAARRASLRFMGHTDPSARARSEPPRRTTAAGGNGNGNGSGGDTGAGTGAQWLTERWGGRHLSFSVPVH